MTRRPTLQDVARESGFSPAAVSLVLNDRPARISEESRKRIRAAAHKLGYRANGMARGLARSRSDIVGLLVPDIENPFFASLAKRLEAQCERAGLGLFITNSDDSAKNDCEQLARLDARGVDGLVVVVSNEFVGGEGSELRAALDRLSAPYVMVDRIIEGLDCDEVLVDNELGAHRAVSHLIEKGHRRIGCVANTRYSQNGRLRLAGYRRALEEAGIGFDASLVAEGDYRVESGYRAVGPLLDAGATAIFSTSDLITAGIMRGLYEQGRRVPERCSIVSFDNSATALFAGPGVSCVEQHVDELAERAFSMLRERMNGYDGPARTHVVEPHLVERASVAAPFRLGASWPQR